MPLKDRDISHFDPCTWSLCYPFFHHAHYVVNRGQRWLAWISSYRMRARPASLILKCPWDYQPSYKEIPSVQEGYEKAEGNAD